MHTEDHDLSRDDTGWWLGRAGAGIMRTALLYGCAAIALAILLTPMLERGKDTYLEQYAIAEPGLDQTVTGSINNTGLSRSNSYVVRKSVLQESPDSICIIRANGQRSGEC